MALFKRKSKDEEKEKAGGAKASAKAADAKAEKKASSPRATGDAHRILLRPIVTEKTARLEKDAKYVFEVAPGANKIEIKKAIKDAYGVDPVGVAVLRILGKPQRGRFGYGRRKTWRKAVVTLKKGQSIEVFSTKA